ncbi:MAG: DUF5916 domain-containing protein [Bacteroidota bacterium]
MKEITFTLVLFGCALCTFANAPIKKSLQAKRTQDKFNIDGNISEIDWQQAEVAEGFIATEPVAGAAATQATEVKILYDDVALYVAAVMYDTAPDSIYKEVRQRDEIGISDWFEFSVSPYQDGNNGFIFTVTAAGTQNDALMSASNGYDNAWDAVWESAVQIQEDGWVVEMRIPYSAIRFPDAPAQQWDINFGRRISRNAEEVYWNTIDPTVDGFLTQAGQVQGITNIKSPVRLSATPFLVTYAQNYYDKNGAPQSTWGTSFNAGMDIKYGINDAFTLDMTLIPDFGEANSDNQILNLGPFEQRFNENRQFFQEGVELFNKGNFFYSRRVGGSSFAPITEDDLTTNQVLVSNSQNAQLLNATKVSGRTTGGLGIGVFNAFEARTKAVIRNTETGEEIEVETHPFTNYNVISLDKNLKNNSYITLINTNVWRMGEAYDANLTGTVFELRDKKNNYALSGKAALSQKYFEESSDLGHVVNLGFGKISGNFNWRINYSEESDTYDPNDLGFLYNNNERQLSGSINLNRYEPIGPFNRMGGGMYLHYNRLYAPNVFTEAGINSWWWGQLKNQWNLNIWSYGRPFKTYDYFEARTEGRYLVIPKMYNIGLNINTDERKPLQIGFNANGGQHQEAGRRRFNLNLYTRYRANSRLSLTAEVGRWKNFQGVGYVDQMEGDIIFGRRDIKTWSNNIGILYTFTPNMGLNFRLRHYWANVRYTDFHLLQEDGYLGNTNYSEYQDTDFDAFNIDLVYRWRFAPGSDIFIVWKNSIFNTSSAETAYFPHLGDVLERPQTNTFSCKIIYFLDYLQLRKA